MEPPQAASDKAEAERERKSTRPAGHRTSLEKAIESSNRLREEMGGRPPATEFFEGYIKINEDLVMKPDADGHMTLPDGTVLDAYLVDKDGKQVGIDSMEGGGKGYLSVDAGNGKRKVYHVGRAQNTIVFGSGGSGDLGGDRGKQVVSNALAGFFGMSKSIVKGASTVLSGGTVRDIELSDELGGYADFWAEKGREATGAGDLNDMEAGRETLSTGVGNLVSQGIGSFVGAAPWIQGVKGVTKMKDANAAGTVVAAGQIGDVEERLEEKGRYRGIHQTFIPGATGFFAAKKFTPKAGSLRTGPRNEALEEGWTETGQQLALRQAGAAEPGQLEEIGKAASMGAIVGAPFSARGVMEQGAAARRRVEDVGAVAQEQGVGPDEAADWFGTSRRAMRKAFPEGKAEKRPVPYREKANSVIRGLGDESAKMQLRLELAQEMPVREADDGVNKKEGEALDRRIVQAMGKLKLFRDNPELKKMLTLSDEGGGKDTSGLEGKEKAKAEREKKADQMRARVRKKREETEQEAAVALLRASQRGAQKGGPSEVRRMTRADVDELLGTRSKLFETMDTDVVKEGILDASGARDASELLERIDPSEDAAARPRRPSRRKKDAGRERPAPDGRLAADAARLVLEAEESAVEARQMRAAGIEARGLEPNDGPEARQVREVVDQGVQKAVSELKGLRASERSLLDSSGQEITDKGAYLSKVKSASLARLAGMTELWRMEQIQGGAAEYDVDADTGLDVAVGMPEGGMPAGRKKGFAERMRLAEIRMMRAFEDDDLGSRADAAVAVADVVEAAAERLAKDGAGEPQEGLEDGVSPESLAAQSALARMASFPQRSSDILEHALVRINPGLNNLLEQAVPIPGMKEAISASVRSLGPWAAYESAPEGKHKDRAARLAEDARIEDEEGADYTRQADPAADASLEEDYGDARPDDADGDVVSDEQVDFEEAEADSQTSEPEDSKLVKRAAAVMKKAAKTAKESLDSISKAVKKKTAKKKATKKEAKKKAPEKAAEPKKADKPTPKPKAPKVIESEPVGFDDREALIAATLDLHAQKGKTIRMVDVQDIVDYVHYSDHAEFSEQLIPELNELRKLDPAEVPDYDKKVDETMRAVISRLIDEGVPVVPQKKLDDSNATLNYSPFERRNKLDAIDFDLRSAQKELDRLKAGKKGRKSIEGLSDTINRLEARRAAVAEREATAVREVKDRVAAWTTADIQKMIAEAGERRKQHQEYMKELAETPTDGDDDLRHEVLFETELAGMDPDEAAAVREMAKKDKAVITEKLSAAERKEARDAAKFEYDEAAKAEVMKTIHDSSLDELEAAIAKITRLRDKPEGSLDALDKQKLTLEIKGLERSRRRKMGNVSWLTERIADLTESLKGKKGDAKKKDEEALGKMKAELKEAKALEAARAKTSVAGLKKKASRKKELFVPERERQAEQEKKSLDMTFDAHEARSKVKVEDTPTQLTESGIEHPEPFRSKGYYDLHSDPKAAQAYLKKIFEAADMPFPSKKWGDAAIKEMDSDPEVWLKKQERSSLKGQEALDYDSKVNRVIADYLYGKAYEYLNEKGQAEQALKNDRIYRSQGGTHAKPDPGLEHMREARNEPGRLAVGKDAEARAELSDYGADLSHSDDRHLDTTEKPLKWEKDKLGELEEKSEKDKTAEDEDKDSVKAFDQLDEVIKTDKKASKKRKKATKLTQSTLIHVKEKQAAVYREIMETAGLSAGSVDDKSSAMYVLTKASQGGDITFTADEVRRLAAIAQDVLSNPSLSADGRMKITGTFMDITQLVSGEADIDGRLGTKAQARKLKRTSEARDEGSPQEPRSEQGLEETGIFREMDITKARFNKPRKKRAKKAAPETGEIIVARDIEIPAADSVQKGTDGWLVSPEGTPHIPPVPFDSTSRPVHSRFGDDVYRMKKWATEHAEDTQARTAAQNLEHESGLTGFAAWDQNLDEQTKWLDENYIKGLKGEKVAYDKSYARALRQRAWRIHREAVFQTARHGKISEQITAPTDQSALATEAYALDQSDNYAPSKETAPYALTRLAAALAAQALGEGRVHVLNGAGIGEAYFAQPESFYQDFGKTPRWLQDSLTAASSASSAGAINTRPSRDPNPGELKQIAGAFANLLPSGAKAEKEGSEYLKGLLRWGPSAAVLVVPQGADIKSIVEKAGPEWEAVLGLKDTHEGGMWAPGEYGAQLWFLRVRQPDVQKAPVGLLSAQDPDEASRAISANIQPSMLMNNRRRKGLVAGLKYLKASRDNISGVGRKDLTKRIADRASMTDKEAARAADEILWSNAANEIGGEGGNLHITEHGEEVLLTAERRFPDMLTATDSSLSGSEPVAWEIPLQETSNPQRLLPANSPKAHAYARVIAGTYAKDRDLFVRAQEELAKSIGQSRESVIAWMRQFKGNQALHDTVSKIRGRMSQTGMVRALSEIYPTVRLMQGVHWAGFALAPLLNQLEDQNKAISYETLREQTGGRIAVSMPQLAMMAIMMESASYERAQMDMTGTPEALRLREAQARQMMQRVRKSYQEKTGEEYEFDDAEGGSGLPTHRIRTDEGMYKTKQETEWNAYKRIMDSLHESSMPGVMQELEARGLVREETPEADRADRGELTPKQLRAADQRRIWTIDLDVIKTAIDERKFLDYTRTIIQGGTKEAPVKWDEKLANPDLNWLSNISNLNEDGRLSLLDDKSMNLWIDETRRSISSKSQRVLAMAYAHRKNLEENVFRPALSAMERSKVKRGSESYDRELTQRLADNFASYLRHPDSPGGPAETKGYMESINEMVNSSTLRGEIITPDGRVSPGWKLSSDDKVSDQFRDLSDASSGVFWNKKALTLVLRGWAAVRWPNDGHGKDDPSNLLRLKETRVAESPLSLPWIPGLLPGLMTKKSHTDAEADAAIKRGNEFLEESNLAVVRGQVGKVDPDVPTHKALSGLASRTPASIRELDKSRVVQSLMLFESAWGMRLMGMKDNPSSKLKVYPEGSVAGKTRPKKPKDVPGINPLRIMIADNVADRSVAHFDMSINTIVVRSSTNHGSQKFAHEAGHALLHQLRLSGMHDHIDTLTLYGMHDTSLDGVMSMLRRQAPELSRTEGFTDPAAAERAYKPLTKTYEILQDQLKQGKSIGSYLKFLQIGLPETKFNQRSRQADGHQTSFNYLPGEFANENWVREHTREGLTEGGPYFSSPEEKAARMIEQYTALWMERRGGRDDFSVELSQATSPWVMAYIRHQGQGSPPESLHPMVPPEEVDNFMKFMEQWFDAISWKGTHYGYKHPGRSPTLMFDSKESIRDAMEQINYERERAAEALGIPANKMHAIDVGDLTPGATIDVEIEYKVPESLMELPESSDDANILPGGKKGIAFQESKVKHMAKRQAHSKESMEEGFRAASGIVSWASIDRPVRKGDPSQRRIFPNHIQAGVTALAILATSKRGNVERADVGIPVSISSDGTTDHDARIKLMDLISSIFKSRAVPVKEKAISSMGGIKGKRVIPVKSDPFLYADRYGRDAIAARVAFLMNAAVGFGKTLTGLLAHGHYALTKAVKSKTTVWTSEKPSLANKTMDDADASSIPTMPNLAVDAVHRLNEGKSAEKAIAETLERFSIQPIDLKETLEWMTGKGKGISSTFGEGEQIFSGAVDADGNERSEQVWLKHNEPKYEGFPRARLTKRVTADLLAADTLLKSKALKKAKKRKKGEHSPVLVMFMLGKERHPDVWRRDIMWMLPKKGMLGGKGKGIDGKPSRILFETYDRLSAIHSKKTQGILDPKDGRNAKLKDWFVPMFANGYDGLILTDESHNMSSAVTYRNPTHGNLARPSAPDTAIKKDDLKKMNVAPFERLISTPGIQVDVTRPRGMFWSLINDAAPDAHLVNMSGTSMKKASDMPAYKRALYQGHNPQTGEPQMPASYSTHNEMMYELSKRSSVDASQIAITDATAAGNAVAIQSEKEESAPELIEIHDEDIAPQLKTTDYWYETFHKFYDRYGDRLEEEIYSKLPDESFVLKVKDVGEAKFSSRDVAQYLAGEAMKNFESRMVEMQQWTDTLLKSNIAVDDGIEQIKQGKRAVFEVNKPKIQAFKDLFNEAAKSGDKVFLWSPFIRDLAMDKGLLQVPLLTKDNKYRLTSKNAVIKSDLDPDAKQANKTVLLKFLMKGETDQSAGIRNEMASGIHEEMLASPNSHIEPTMGYLTRRFIEEGWNPLTQLGYTLSGDAFEMLADPGNSFEVVRVKLAASQKKERAIRSFFRGQLDPETDQPLLSPGNNTVPEKESVLAIVITSGSAGTGIDLHDRTYQPVVHYVLDSGHDPVASIQVAGRMNRLGQLSEPLRKVFVLAGSMFDKRMMRQRLTRTMMVNAGTTGARSNAEIIESIKKDTDFIPAGTREPKVMAMISSALIQLYGGTAMLRKKGETKKAWKERVQFLSASGRPQLKKFGLDGIAPDEFSRDLGMRLGFSPAASSLITLDAMFSSSAMSEARSLMNRYKRLNDREKKAIEAITRIITDVVDELGINFSPDEDGTTNISKSKTLLGSRFGKPVWLHMVESVRKLEPKNWDRLSTSLNLEPIMYLQPNGDIKVLSRETAFGGEWLPSGKTHLTLEEALDSKKYILVWSLFNGVKIVPASQIESVSEEGLKVLGPKERALSSMSLLPSGLLLAAQALKDDAAASQLTGTDMTRYVRGVGRGSVFKNYESSATGSMRFDHENAPLTTIGGYLPAVNLPVPKSGSGTLAGIAKDAHAAVSEVIDFRRQTAYLRLKRIKATARFLKAISKDEETFSDNVQNFKMPTHEVTPVADPFSPDYLSNIDISGFDEGSREAFNDMKSAMQETARLYESYREYVPNRIELEREGWHEDDFTTKDAASFRKLAMAKPGTDRMRTLAGAILSGGMFMNQSNDFPSLLAEGMDGPTSKATDTTFFDTMQKVKQKYSTEYTLGKYGRTHYKLEGDLLLLMLGQAKHWSSGDTGFLHHDLEDMAKRADRNLEEQQHITDSYMRKLSRFEERLQDMPDIFSQGAELANLAAQTTFGSEGIGVEKKVPEDVMARRNEEVQKSIHGYLQQFGDSRSKIVTDVDEIRRIFDEQVGDDKEVRTTRAVVTGLAAGETGDYISYSKHGGMPETGTFFDGPIAKRGEFMPPLTPGDGVGLPGLQPLKTPTENIPPAFQGIVNAINEGRGVIEVSEGNLVANAHVIRRMQQIFNTHERVRAEQGSKVDKKGRLHLSPDDLMDIHESKQVRDAIGGMVHEIMERDDVRKTIKPVEDVSDLIAILGVPLEPGQLELYGAEVFPELFSNWKKTFPSGVTFRDWTGAINYFQGTNSSGEMLSDQPADIDLKKKVIELAVRGARDTVKANEQEPRARRHKRHWPDIEPKKKRGRKNQKSDE